MRKMSRRTLMTAAAGASLAPFFYPDHFDIGWHITGSAGVFGAAAAAGRLLGLAEQQMVWALGLAASRSAR